MPISVTTMALMIIIITVIKMMIIMVRMISLSLYLYVYMSTYLSIYLSVSICPTMFLSISVYIYLYIRVCMGITATFFSNPPSPLPCLPPNPSRRSPLSVGAQGGQPGRGHGRDRLLAVAGVRGLAAREGLRRQRDRGLQHPRHRQRRQGL